MANYLEKVRIKTATEGTHKRVMQATHDTSADFGQFNVLKAKYLELGKGTIIPWTYSNMQPMPQPTFGEVIYEDRIWFVPFRLIFKGYEDARQDIIHTNGNETTTALQTLPYTTQREIVDCIRSMMTACTATDPWDYKIDNNGTSEYYEVTDKAKWAIKFLNSMGYRWCWKYGYTGPDIPFNVLKILAATKVYIDWYYNSAYIGDTDYNQAKQQIERDNGNLLYDTNDLYYLINICYKVYYNMDYFTSAWDNPNHPNLTGQESLLNLTDPNEYNVAYLSGGTAYNTNPQTRNTGKDPFIGAEGPSSNATDGRVGGPITQFTINALKALQSFLKRNQLAGARTLERYLSRYGETNAWLRMQRSQLVGTVKWGMNVNPIFSTADTAASGGEVLGSYAGQASGVSGKKGQHQFTLETNEDGVLLETLVIRPIENYTQGLDKENNCMTVTDLLTPEFDNVGVDTVMACELVMPQKGGEPVDNNNIYAQIFGFQPKYAYWKVMKDNVTGNFADPNWENIFLPYTFKRQISMNTPIANIVHSKAFTRMEDSDQFDRIFYAQMSKKPFDNFNIHHELLIEWWSYAKPLYDIYEWEHEGGKTLEIQNQGNVG